MKDKRMDITLKQTEIEAAIRRYVSETIGVNLTNKRLGIQFSATRGASGVMANLSIEDASEVVIPGYTDRNADPVNTTQELPKLASVTRLAGDLQVEGTISAGKDVIAGADVAKPNTIGAAIAGSITETAAEPAGDASDDKTVPVEAVEGAPAAKAGVSGLFDND